MSNPIQLQPVAPDVYVGPQMSPEAMAEVARLGFRSVVNNRPDFEHGPDQPSNASIEAAATAAGMEYRFLPVNGMFQTPAEIAAFGELMKTLPRPILVFCRSGARSAKLFMAANAG